MLIVFMCLYFFNFISCGIDDITVIDEPSQTIHVPVYTNAFDESYFEFWTNEVNAATYSGCKFLGTEVYYRIYSSSSKMISDVNALASISTNENTSAVAADRLIESYKYTILKASNQPKNTLIPTKNKNQQVYIRLTDYQNDDYFSARILLGGKDVGTNLSGSDIRCVPLRNNDDNELSFNFGRSSVDSKKNKVPVSDDTDVKYDTSDAEDGKWYVAMFAVAAGQDIQTFKKIHSNILYLGSVTIDANSFDN